MSTTLEAYRIFIASPGGLKDIRECFRSTTEKYNETDANRRGVTFIPVGWEATLGGIGRPQAIINDDLAECDYCVLVLHDRWGTPASDEPNALTGTEEEFQLAMKLIEDPNSPMQRIVVFFVAVDPGKMSDPGPQLQKVLDFRKQIEAERKLLYQQVEGERDFADELRKHLAQWVRDHEARKGGGAVDEQFEAAGAQPALPAPAPSTSTAGEPQGAIAEAAKLMSEANFTEAERLLATAAAKNDNPAALLAYAELLARLNRRRQAIDTYEATVGLADDAGEPAIGAQALLALARLRDDLGMGDAAEEAAHRAIELYSRIDDQGGAARSYILLGERSRRVGAFRDAEKLYRTAIDLSERAGDRAVEADALIGLSEVYRDESETSRDTARLEEAREALCRGIALKQEDGATDLGDAHAALGAILERLNDEEGADNHYRMSLNLFREKGDRSGMADAADHLAQVCERRGALDDAEDAFRESASMFEVLQNTEGAADAYLSLGRIQIAKGDREGAEASLRSALSLADRRRGDAARALQEEITDLLTQILGPEEAPQQA
ncbi:MAG: DUF4062 domain-containing protein [Allosphingosinicella sp.]